MGPGHSGLTKDDELSSPPEPYSGPGPRQRQPVEDDQVVVVDDDSRARDTHPGKHGAEAQADQTGAGARLDDAGRRARDHKRRRPSHTARPQDGVQAINASNSPGAADSGSGQPRSSSKILKIKTGKNSGKPEGSPEATVTTALTTMGSHLTKGIHTLERLRDLLQARDKKHAAEMAKKDGRIKELEEKVEALSQDRAERKRKATSELENKAKRFIQNLFEDSD